MTYAEMLILMRVEGLTVPKKELALVEPIFAASILCSRMNSLFERYPVLGFRPFKAAGYVYHNEVWENPMLEGTSAEVYKYPFIFELDAVAYKWNEGSSGGPGRGGSVEIGLYHNGELKRIGGLRSGLSYDRLDYMKEHLEAGEKVVVRVRFLGKRTIGTFLNQPRCEEIRLDKLASACVTNQLVELLGVDRAEMFDEAPSVKE